LAANPIAIQMGKKYLHLIFIFIERVIAINGPFLFQMQTLLT